MADAGFKLAVEGEREFKKAIAEINAQIKANAAELKLLTAQYGAADTGMEKLTANQKALEEGLALQGQKVSALREQYEKASATYGETDVRVVKLKTSLTEATAEYAKMSGEAEKNQAAIDAGWKAMEDYREATKKASEVVGGLDDIMAQNRKEIENLTEQYRKLGDGSRDAAAKQENLTAQNKLLADSAESQRKRIDALNEELDAAVRLYGENSEEVRGYKDAVNDATRELNSLEDQIKDNDRALEDSEDAGDGLLESLEKISEQTGIEIPDGIKKMIGSKSGGGFVGAAEKAAAIAIGLKASQEIIQKILETADKYKGVYNEATALGMGTEEYQKLQYTLQMIGIEASDTEEIFQSLSEKMYESQQAVAGYSGSLEELKTENSEALRELEEWATANTPEWDDSAEDLFESYSRYEKEMESFSREYSQRLQEINNNYRKSVDELDKSTQEATGMFSNFGIEVIDGTGKLRETEEVFYDVIRAFGQYANDTERITNLQQIFGGAAGKVNIAVNAGYDALKKYSEQAVEAGAVIDEVTVNQLYGMSTGFDALSRKVEITGDKLWVFLNDLFSFDAWGSGSLGRSASSLWQSITGMFKIPPYANGTYNHVGGYALVGEKGPEIVELPRGSRVYPSGTGPQMGTVNNYSITISAKDVREFNDIVRIAEGQKQSIRMGYGRR